MPDGQVLEFSGVVKRFGDVSAVAGLSARVEPGRVTGFLGPNGAGKTTSLRILLGLVKPTEGTATIGGRPYAKLERPLQTVGAALEASSFHPGRTAANHLLVYARAAGIPRTRIDEVLGLVGLADVAGRKVGGFSLGMRQRLGLAGALLGDPGVLVLDEPSNGLDPEGIRWMRGLLRGLAAEGRTVLISSHLLAEVQQTVDALLIIASGRLVYQGDLENLADPSAYATVVDAPDRASLATAITNAGLDFTVLRNGLTVHGAEPVEVGAIAATAGIALSSLQRRGAGLEEVFLELVNGERTHPSARATDAAPVAVAAAAAPESGPTPEPELDHAAEDQPAAPAPEDEALPEAETRPETEDRPEPEEAGAEEAPELFEPEPEPAWATSTAAFTVARTGVIDIVPTIEHSDAVSDEASAAEPVLPSPQEQPSQPGSLSWRAEPTSPPQTELADDAALAGESPRPEDEEEQR